MSLGAIRGKQPLPGCDSRDVPWAPASGRDELCFRNANFTAFGIKMWRKAAQVELCALGTAECPLLGPTKALKAFLVQVPALSVPLSAEGDQFCCLPLLPGRSRAALRGFVAAQGELSRGRDRSMASPCSLSPGLRPDVLHSWGRCEHCRGSCPGPCWHSCPCPTPGALGRGRILGGLTFLCL